MWIKRQNPAGFIRARMPLALEWKWHHSTQELKERPIMAHLFSGFGQMQLATVKTNGLNSINKPSQPGLHPKAGFKCSQSHIFYWFQISVHIANCVVL